MRKPSEAVQPPESDSHALAPRSDDGLAGSGARPAPEHDGQAGPLDARALELLSRAGAQARVLRRAVWLAYTNGGTLLLCAIGCLPFALFDAWLLLPALALAASGSVELHGARLLQRFDLRAPRRLVLNQLALLALVGLYCVASSIHALIGPSASAALVGSSPELADQLRDLSSALDVSNADLDRGARTLSVVFYAIVFGACALYQGFCANYYRTRAAVLRAFVDETPAWVREAQRRLSG